MTGVLARNSSKQRDTPSEVSVLPRPLFFSQTICSFLKEIDDVDVIDVTTWS